MMETYWNQDGELQKEYDVMLEAVRKGKFKFTKTAEKLFHSYYRYYNDGDLPGWTRNRWSLTKMGRWGRELNEAGEQFFEERITDRLIAEWKRYKRTNK